MQADQIRAVNFGMTGGQKAQRAIRDLMNL